MTTWDTEPAKDIQRANTSREVAPHRSTKDRRRWCRGKVGVEHKVAVRVGGERWPAPERSQCYRPEWLPEYWHCSHERFCTTCGKIMQRGFGIECPDFTAEITWFRPWKSQ